jgi:hypothetical protein
MITCKGCQTENVDDAQYCDECGLPLSGTTAASGAPPPPLVPMLNKPAARAGDAAVVGESGIVSPDAPTRHDGGSPVASGIASESLSPAGSSSSSAARAKPSAAVGAVVMGAHHTRATAHAALVINRGRSAGKEFPVHEDEAYIGRWDADSGIFPDVDLDSDDPEAKVSRRHARITRRGEGYFIEDLGSTNGTFVNRGRRLLPGDRQLLNDGDEIIIGKTFLRFHVTK